MRKVLILTEHFAPAYKAGGIVRCLENMVVHLQHCFQFFILTSNSNLDKSERLEGVIHDKWVYYDEAIRVFYASGKNQKFTLIKKTVESILPDVVYVNGLYSTFFTLMPLWLTKRITLKPVTVLAPWGMLHKGCLSIKPLKKKIFFYFFKLLGLSTHVQWHATNWQEQNDIFQMFGNDVKIIIVNPLTSCLPALNSITNKSERLLRLVTVSLVAQKKGHLRVIKALRDLQGEIKAEYHIYGPVKDIGFWQTCLNEINTLGHSVKVIYHGFLNPSNVTSAIQKNHFFILHSDGENFCQAIYEALAAGRPVITSDQTPWIGLQEEQAGWNVELNDFASLKETIRKAYLMKQQPYEEFCAGAREKARRFVEDQDIKKQYAKLF